MKKTITIQNALFPEFSPQQILIDQVCLLIQKTFSLAKVSICPFDLAPQNQTSDSGTLEIVFDFAHNFSGLLRLEGIRAEELSQADLALLNNLLMMLAEQFSGLQRIFEASSAVNTNRKEIEILSRELELAYADLNTAHEELSDAYNLGQLLSRNLSRTRIEVKSFLEQAPIAFGILRHRRLKIEVANRLILKLWGKDKKVIGQTLADALPELAGQPYLDILDEVYTSGERYVGREAPVELEMQGKIETVYFNFIYEPIKNEKNITNAIMIIATDVTELVQCRLQTTE